MGKRANLEKKTELRTHSPQETKKLAFRLSPLLYPRDVISLTGDLGAGKTCFVQGLAKGLGIKRKVTSPTFVIIREYKGKLPVYHFDLYRLSLEELEDLGYEEYLFGDGVSVIEWGEKIYSLLSGDFLEIELKRTLKEKERKIKIVPHGVSWVERVKRWFNADTGF